MKPPLPFPPFALALVLLAGGPFCRAQEKAPSVIPPPRAEPVVPPSPAKSIATQLNDAYVNVFERVAPGVVVIDVTKKASADGDTSDVFPDFFHGGPGGDTDSTAPHHHAGPSSEGSGFVIQSSGYILTNNHVVAGATDIKVRLKDGRPFAARLIGADEKTDIAVVKIDAADLPVEELADSDTVRVGEIACAIGVPYNQKYSFTTGVVSAKDRVLGMTGPDGYEDYLQTDASINPGNSGGPLVNLDGKVIGMNTLINGLNRGLGFAIPSNMLREVGDQLIHAGHVVRPYIGVRIETLDEAVEKYGPVFGGVKKGVVISTILADSPAFKNNELHTADVITEVDGVPIGSDRELQKQILSKRIGTTVQVTVIRKGKTIKVPMTTSELPATASRGGQIGGEEAEAEAVRQESNRLFGMQLQELTRELANNLGVTAAAGVVVTNVADDSPAARAKIMTKDVITTVEDRPVKDTASFKEAAKGGDLKRGIMCHIERPSGKTFAVLRAD